MSVTTPTTPELDEHYRPHLDGLRAVAVYLVVLFHAGSGWFPGGYVGVDVFFVLSGFLVTQLLVRDIAHNNSIRFGRFYSRRFRRLLPAAFVALTVTALVYTAIASPAEVLAAAGSFKAAFLYSTNWYFIHQATGYFGADITTNPVLHFWSLAVEEQFYLLWPLALGGAFALTRRMDHTRQLRTIRIAVAVGALASVALALSLRTSDPNHAYYGTDTRAYELLAGALLALTPRLFVATAKRYRRSLGIGTAVSIAALLVLASSWVTLDAIERGVLVTITTCTLIVALEAADGEPVKRLLSTRSAVYLGKISYGTYLWHWLVILVVIRTFHISTLSTIGIAFLVATALAALSYEMLEHPIRVSRVLNEHRRTVIAGGLAISVASALVLIPAIVVPANATTPSVHSSITTGFTPVPPNLDWQHATAGRSPFVNCWDKPASACTIVHGHGSHILLIGDSEAQALIPAFVGIARQSGFTLSVSVWGRCPWQRDLYTPVRSGTCRSIKEDLYKRVIPALKPDVVVAMNLEYEKITPFVGPDGTVPKLGSAANLRWIDTTTERSLAELRAGGRKVVLIEPIPRNPTDPIACIFDSLVCPYLPICDPVVNGRLVKSDLFHLTPRFVETLAPFIDKYLKQNGITPS